MSFVITVGIVGRFQAKIFGGKLTPFSHFPFPPSSSSLPLEVGPLNTASGLGEQYKFSQRGLELSPSGNRILLIILAFRSDIWWHQIYWFFSENQLTTVCQEYGQISRNCHWIVLSFFVLSFLSKRLTKPPKVRNEYRPLINVEQQYMRLKKLHPEFFSIPPTQRLWNLLKCYVPIQHLRLHKTAKNYPIICTVCLLSDSLLFGLGDFLQHRFHAAQATLSSL